MKFAENTYTFYSSFARIKPKIQTDIQLYNLKILLSKLFVN